MNSEQQKNNKKRGFQKGKSGNPGGRPRLDKDILDSRKMLKNDICRAVIRIRSMSFTKAKSLFEDIKSGKDKTISLGEFAIMKAFLTGDYRGIDYYESRVLGKVEQPLNLSAEGFENIEININMRQMDEDKH